MNLRTKTCRRWFGGLCLLTAVGMLVAGETVLEGRLSPIAFLSYWSTCFLVTALAATASLLEVAWVRTESRHEQRDLLEETLRKLESEKRRRPSKKR